MTLANLALSSSENLRTCAAISTEDVVVVVSSDMTLAISEIAAEPIEDGLDEGGFEFEVCVWVFLSGHMQAMWPCFEHSKHHPSCLCFCFSVSVVAFHTVALVSMAFRSHGGSWVQGGRVFSPSFHLQKNCPHWLLFFCDMVWFLWFRLGMFPSFWACSPFFWIQPHCWACAANVHCSKFAGFSSSIHASARGIGSPSWNSLMAAGSLMLISAQLARNWKSAMYWSMFPPCIFSFRRSLWAFSLAV